MISECYAIDDLLVCTNETVVTVMIQSYDSGSGKWVATTTLDNDQIISESLEIKQSICDTKEIKIGGCIPSQLTLNIMDVSEDLSGKRIAVTVHGRYRRLIFPSNTLFPKADLYPNSYADPNRETTSEYVLFVGEIYSCNRTNNKRIRKLIAFDRMYHASTILCKEKIKNLFDGEHQESLDGHTFQQIFNSNLIKPKAQIEVPTDGFVNIDTEINLSESNWEKSADKNLTLLDFYADLCELNGVFLIEDSPPPNCSTADYLGSYRALPRAIKPYENITFRNDILSYSRLIYEDFQTIPFHYVNFEHEYCIWNRSPTVGYSRYLSDNPIIFSAVGSTAANVRDNLKDINSNDHDTITGPVYGYRPFKASIFNRWWVQVGDRVRIPTRNDSVISSVESIVFSRTIRGMNAMMVEIEAKGVEIMGKEEYS